MRQHLRVFPVLLASLLVIAACDDDPGPSGPTVGLPASLSPASVTTPKNTAVEATVPVSTIDGRDLDYSVLSGPANGTIELFEESVGLRVRYTPTTGFSGQDQVTYRVDDGVSTVDGEVNITVTNAVPTAQSVTLRRAATQPVTIELSGSDPDGDALTFEVVSAPTGGTLSGLGSGAASGGTLEVTYTPDSGELGDDSFTYRASDGTDASPAVTVNLTANRLPVVTVEGGTPVVVRRNAPTRIEFSIEDEDRDDVVPTLGDAPSHGTVDGLEAWADGWRILYTPDVGFVGDDSFILLLNDGLDQIEFEVELTVVNDGPVAFNASQVGFVGADVVLTLTAADPDGDPLTFEIVTPPTVGTLGEVVSVTPTTAEVVFSPGAAMVGSHVFTFRVTDGVAYSDAATFTVQLQTGAPFAQPMNVTVVENSSVDITLTGIDQQGDSLGFAIASAPSNGTLGPIVPLGLYTARVTYTPTPGYDGSDLFTFTVTDGTLVSVPATVGISVTPAPDSPPIVVGAPNESATTHTNVPLQVAAARSVSPAMYIDGTLLDNFIDLDGDGLTASLVPGSVTAGATVVVNADGTFTYTSPPGRTADDTFDYTVTDGITPVTRTVTISFDDPIWFVDDSFAGVSDGSAAAPFTTLAAASGAAAAGEIIFVHTGNTGVTPLAGGFTFAADQQLIGEPAGLSTANGPIVDASAVAQPAVTNAAGDGVTLAAGATLRGIHIDSPTGAGIAAASIAGATVDAVTVTDPGAAGVELDAPTGAWTFTGVTVTGATGQAVQIDGGSPTISAEVDITHSNATPSIMVENVTGGDINFSGSIDDTGAGIVVQDNTGGVITFSNGSKVLSTGTDVAVSLIDNAGAGIAFTGGGLELTTTAANAFVATGGGVVTVEGPGNSIDAAGGTQSVHVLNTTIGAAGMTFESISSDGAANGVVVDGAGTGTFTVTGVGSTDGSGGTITNTTSDGAYFTATGAVSLANMIVGDPAATAAEAPDGVTFIDGAGVRGGALTGGAALALDNMLISRTSGHGVAANGLTDLVVSDSEILNVDRRGFDFTGDGLIGSASISNTVIDGFLESAIDVDRSTGTVSLTLSGVTIADSQDGNATGSGANGVSVQVSGTAAAFVEVTGSSAFERLDGVAINIGSSDTAEFDLTVTGADIDDLNGAGGAINVDSDGSGASRVAVSGGTITNLSSGSGVIVFQQGTSTIHTLIDGISVGSGAAGSGAATGEVGVGFIHVGTGTSFFEVRNSIFTNHGAGGIFSANSESGGGAEIDSHLILTGNTVGTPEDVGAGGILIQSEDDHTVCSQVSGNTSAGSGGLEGIQAQQADASVFQFVEAGVPIAFDTWLAANNTSTASAVGVFSQVGTACIAPTAPITP